MATLYLIPSLLGDTAPIDTLPANTQAVLRRLEHFVVETPKRARAFLKAAGMTLADRPLHLQVLDEHTPPGRIAALLAPLHEGHDMGILTDTGCPGIADPGARLVAAAHEHGIAVVPLVGPSAVLLALMASGLDGQRFVFHGYLPIDKTARAQTIALLESQSRNRSQAQIAIEAPYRNLRLFEALLEACAADTRLCVATDLTLPTEFISTRTIAQWRAAAPPPIDKRPTMFLWQAGAATAARRPRARR